MRPCERIECGSERGTEQTRTATSGKTGHLMQIFCNRSTLIAIARRCPLRGPNLGAYAAPRVLEMSGWLHGARPNECR